MVEKAKSFKRHGKKKLIIIIGYNGFDFCGSQKQNGGDHADARTVEGELEKALF